MSGVSKDAEMSMIIEVVECNQSYSGTIQNQTLSSDSDDFHLEAVEHDLLKDVKPSILKLTKISKASTNIDGPACGVENVFSKYYRLGHYRLQTENSQVVEQINHGQFESVEPRSLSLDWDISFFADAGLLNDEELSIVNKGFKTSESNQSSYGTQVCGRDHTSLLTNDEFNLEALDRGLFKDVTPYSRTILGKKMCVTFDNHGKSKSAEPTRLSLDWDNAFMTSSGLLNNEELSMINKLIKTNQSSSGTRIDVQPLRVSDLEALEGDLLKDIKSEAMKDIKSPKENVCISEVDGQWSDDTTPFSRIPSAEFFSSTSSQVLERINHYPFESVESRRASLDWDTVFFTSAGLLKDKELSRINKGFKKPKSNQLDSNSFFDLKALEADLFKDVKKRRLYKLNKRSKVATNVAERASTYTKRKSNNNSPSSVLSPLLSSSSSFHDAASASSITKIKSSGLQTSSYSPLETLVAELFKELLVISLIKCTDSESEAAAKTCILSLDTWIDTINPFVS